MSGKILTLGAALWLVALQAGAAAPAASAEKLVVYYFHGDFRCASCLRLEQYTKETVEENFKPELGSGKMEFKAVNVETRGNEHFVDDYKLYTKSVVLSLRKDGKEIKSENLPKVWEYLGNKQRFSVYLKGEIDRYLRGG